MDVEGYVVVLILFLILSARPWYQPCSVCHCDPADVDRHRPRHSHHEKHKRLHHGTQCTTGDWDRQRWEGMYNRRRFAWAALVGIALLGILFVVFWRLGSNMFLWFLLVLFALAGLVPIVISLTAPDYKHTIQALMQRVTQLSPREERVSMLLFVAAPTIIIYGCSRMGSYIWPETPDAAVTGLSIGVLIVSLFAIYVILNFNTQTVIVWSQGLQNSESSGMIPVPIAVNPSSVNAAHDGGGGSGGGSTSDFGDRSLPQQQQQDKQISYAQRSLTGEHYRRPMRTATKSVSGGKMRAKSSGSMNQNPPRIGPHAAGGVYRGGPSFARIQSANRAASSFAPRPSSMVGAPSSSTDMPRVTKARSTDWVREQGEGDEDSGGRLTRGVSASAMGDRDADDHGESTSHPRRKRDVRLQEYGESKQMPHAREAYVDDEDYRVGNDDGEGDADYR